MCESRAKTSGSNDRASEGLIICGRVTRGREILGTPADVISCKLSGMIHKKKKKRKKKRERERERNKSSVSIQRTFLSRLVANIKTSVSG